MTQIIVSGFPRHRSSETVSVIADKFCLDRPNNKWGETHKYGENKEKWLAKNNAIFKLWPIHDNNFINTLENYEGNIIFNYSEDIALFSAKLFRAECTKDWGTSLRNKEKISYFENKDILDRLIPDIISFCDGTVNAMSSKNILLKSVFINKTQVSCHIQSSFNIDMLRCLKNISKEYIEPLIDEYLSDGKEEFYEQIYKDVGRTL